MNFTENYQLTLYEPNDVTNYMQSTGWNGTMSKLDTAMKAIENKADKNGLDLSTLEQQVSTNTDEINQITDEVSGLTQTVNGNTANIAGLNTRVTKAEAEIVNLKETAGTEKYFYGILSANETTLAITIDGFADNTLVDVYCSVWGDSPKTLELRAANGGQPNLCVTTWTAKNSDRQVAVKITTPVE